ncbi:hypothetical protein ACROYT_G012797 [Oculina patagonica]
MRVTTFLVFISMLLMLSLNLEEVEAIAFCHTDGCNFSFNLSDFYKRHFNLACHKHDACYACGVIKGWSRYLCDWAFKRDMKYLCMNLSGAQRPSCYTAAKNYYKAVRRLGGSYYKNPSVYWCRYCPVGAPNVSVGSVGR